MPRAEPARRSVTPLGIPTVLLPAPNPLQHQTLRHATPPPELAAIRRAEEQPTTDPPKAASAVAAQPSAPAATSIDVESLRRRAEAAEAALAKVEAKAKVDLIELERQQRVQLESLRPGPYQQPIELRPAPAPVAPAPAPATESARPESLQQAKNRFLTKLFGYGTIIIIPFGGWLVSVVGSWETRAKTERSEVKSDVAKSIAEGADTKVNANAKETATWSLEFRQYRANRREIDRLQGIEYPKVEGDPDPENLEPMTRLCPAGKVCPGPQIVLRRAP